jgi:hypothetical protein
LHAKYEKSIRLDWTLTAKSYPFVYHTDYATLSAARTELDGGQSGRSGV